MQTATHNLITKAPARVRWRVFLSGSGILPLIGQAEMLWQYVSRVVPEIKGWKPLPLTTRQQVPWPARSLLILRAD